MKTRILALGAQSKGSFCLIKNGKLHVSNSFGDLSEAENFHRFEKEVKKIKPEIIACDLHPEYASTKLADNYLKTSRRFSIMRRMWQAASLIITLKVR